MPEPTNTPSTPNCIIIAASAGVATPPAAHRLDHIPCTCLALGADHGRAFADAAQRLAEIAASAHKRDPIQMLVDVMALVRRRQHLGFVDVVDAQGLQDLRLHEMPDAAFG